MLGHYATSNVVRCAWLAEAKTLAFALGEQGIHVNTLSLRGTLAPWYRAGLEKRAAGAGVSFEERLAEETANIPLRKYGTPEEVAIAVQGLLSPFSDHMTGSTSCTTAASRGRIVAAQSQFRTPTPHPDRGLTAVDGAAAMTEEVGSGPSYPSMTAMFSSTPCLVGPLWRPGTPVRREQAETFEVLEPDDHRGGCDLAPPRAPNLTPRREGELRIRSIRPSLVVPLTANRAPRRQSDTATSFGHLVHAMLAFSQDTGRNGAGQARWIQRPRFFAPPRGSPTHSGAVFAA